MKNIIRALNRAFHLPRHHKVAHADDYLRIGMEAAYAPFNWTQEDDANGAVKIDGTNQYANGYDVQIAKKLLRS